LLGVNGGESRTVEGKHLKYPNRRMTLSIDCSPPEIHLPPSLIAGHPSKHCTNNPNKIGEDDPNIFALYLHLFAGKEADPSILIDCEDLGPQRPCVMINCDLSIRYP